MANWPNTVAGHHPWNRLTLGSDENDWDFGGVAVMRHFRIISVDRVEARLVLQAKHENYGVNPSGELRIEIARKSVVCQVQLSIVRRRTMKPRRHQHTHLHFGCASLVAYQQQITLVVNLNLFLESPAFGRLLLHVTAGQIAVDESGLAGVQRPHNAQTKVGHSSWYRPFLAVDKRICVGKSDVG